MYNWRFNGATGAYIADVTKNIRLVRTGRDGKFLYRAEYWGDYSLKYPIGFNALTARNALALLRAEIAGR